jgi:transposase
MKDGRTHLAHKAEQAADLETGAVVAVTVQPADEGDTNTIEKTITKAAENVEKAVPDSDGVQELVADKGYHSNEVVTALAELGVRTYISEPNRGRRNWKGKQTERDAVYRNRRRIRGERGRAACCANAGSDWNDHLLMRTKQGDCAEFICGDDRTS